MKFRTVLFLTKSKSVPRWASWDSSEKKSQFQYKASIFPWFQSNSNRKSWKFCLWGFVGYWMLGWCTLEWNHQRISIHFYYSSTLKSPLWYRNRKGHWTSLWWTHFCRKAIIFLDFLEFCQTLQYGMKVSPNLWSFAIRQNYWTKNVFGKISEAKDCHHHFIILYSKYAHRCF